MEKILRPNKDKMSGTFKLYCIKTLKEVKEDFNNINKKFENVIKSINYIVKEIDNCITLLTYAKEYSEKVNKKDIFSKLKVMFEEYNNSISDIKNINNYNDMNIKLAGIVDLEFDPPININSINDSINDSIFDSYDMSINSSILDYNFYNSYIEDKDIKQNTDNNNNIQFKCSIYKNEESCFYCTICNMLSCNKCLNKEKNSKKHKFIYFDKAKSDREKNKLIFFNSLEILIKNIFKKCSSLLKNEKIKLKNSENKNNTPTKNKFIFKVIQYPYITEGNDIQFLKDINTLFENEIKNKESNSTGKSFHIYELNKELIQVIKNIFYDKKINLFKDNLEIIENNFISENAENEESDISKIIKYNNISKEYKNIEDENNYNKLQNFKYVINIIPKANKDFKKDNIVNILINKFNNDLNIDKKNILITFNNKRNFIDAFIKTIEFSQLFPNEIKRDYFDFPELYEIKLLITKYLQQECNINKKYFDYRGNSINPNKELYLFRGTQKYNPPYGWIGIGIKVIGIYEDDIWINDKSESSRWGVVYYAITGTLTGDFTKRLNDIITKNKQITNNNKKYFYINDKVNLYPDINAAEKNTDTLYINNKFYKIILMAKVLIEKIKSSKYFDYWILDKENIRIYRILFKEVI